jgi:hypothetical protein
LFDDLEAQLEREQAAEQWAEVAERSRAEFGRIALADRLRAHVGQQLTLRLRSGDQVDGVIADVAVEWLTLTQGTNQVLVPVDAVTAVAGLSRAVATDAGAVLRRLGLRHALRALARDRAPVRLGLLGGEVTGTIDRVGADHIDVAEHPAGEARRAGAVRQVLSIRLAALLTVRSTTF